MSLVIKLEISLTGFIGATFSKVTIRNRLFKLSNQLCYKEYGFLEIK